MEKPNVACLTKAILCQNGENQQNLTAIWWSLMVVKVYIYIYIYIERERERVIECLHSCWWCPVQLYQFICVPTSSQYSHELCNWIRGYHPASINGCITRAHVYCANICQCSNSYNNQLGSCFLTLQEIDLLLCVIDHDQSCQDCGTLYLQRVNNGDPPVLRYAIDINIFCMKLNPIDIQTVDCLCD